MWSRCENKSRRRVENNHSERERHQPSPANMRYALSQHISMSVPTPHLAPRFFDVQVQWLPCVSMAEIGL